MATPTDTTDNTPKTNEIQGDVVLGLQKGFESFVFFQIDTQDIKDFQEALAKLDVSSTDTVIEKDGAIAKANEGAKSKIWIDINHTNIAFTARGLAKLGISDAEMPKDAPFRAGQYADDTLLDDHNVWEPAFTRKTIDGVLILTSSTALALQQHTLAVLAQFGNSLNIEYNITGAVRPGPEAGHEHFGFRDGISLPTLESVKKHTPGRLDVVEDKVILTGFANAGDIVEPFKRPLPLEPKWATNGSYLVFRQLEQLVPEFHKFTREEAARHKAKHPESTPALIAARMVGRWPSGAPLDKAALKDDPLLAADPDRVNDFDMADDPEQQRCPYVAHTRKTNPRKGGAANPRDFILPHLMVRNGIPYGPELDLDEIRSDTTSKKNARGLLFASYQGTITEGFQFVQRDWSNSTGFPFGNKLGLTGKLPGTDLIIGQSQDKSRTAQGIVPVGLPVGSISAQGITNNDPENTTTADPFIISRGGEYFFVPPVGSLKAKLAGVADAAPVGSTAPAAASAGGGALSAPVGVSVQSAKAVGQKLVDQAGHHHHKH